MQQFIDQYREQISGVLSGFDRLVFQGSLRRLNCGQWDPKWQTLVARGMEEYLWQNKILFQDYAEHVRRVSTGIQAASEEAFRKPGLAVISHHSVGADK